MAEVNFYLRDKNAENATAVMMFFSFNAQRIKIGTVERINPKFWDNDKQKAKQTKQFVQYPEFNTRLDRLRQSALDTYRQYLNDNQHKEPSALLIKSLINGQLKPTEKKKKTVITNLISFTENFIAKCQSGSRLGEKGTPIKTNTLKIYITFLKNLKEFKSVSGRNLSFESINLEFFEEYKEWMTVSKQYSTNTLSKHIRTIRLIVNEALEDGYVSVPFTGKRFRAQTEQTESVYLTKAELQTLENIDFSSNSRLDRVRDLFLVGCWTGLRFSDFSNIKAQNIKDGFIKIKTMKTGKEVIIPIHPVVNRIIAKYSALTENSLPPALSNQKMNEYLKEVMKVAGFDMPVVQSQTKGGRLMTITEPKYNLITCHTARRSFASNAYYDNIQTISIMAITGHTTESSFMKYIKITPEEHAKKIQSIWSENQ